MAASVDAPVHGPARDIDCDALREHARVACRISVRRAIRVAATGVVEDLVQASAAPAVYAPEDCSSGYRDVHGPYPVSLCIGTSVAPASHRAPVPSAVDVPDRPAFYGHLDRRIVAPHRGPFSSVVRVVPCPEDGCHPGGVLDRDVGMHHALRPGIASDAVRDRPAGDVLDQRLAGDDHLGRAGDRGPSPPPGPLDIPQGRGPRYQDVGVSVDGPVIGASREDRGLQDRDPRGYARGSELVLLIGVPGHVQGRGVDIDAVPFAPRAHSAQGARADERVEDGDVPEDELRRLGHGPAVAAADDVPVCARMDYHLGALDRSRARSSEDLRIAAGAGPAAVRYPGSQNERLPVGKDALRGVAVVVCRPGKGDAVQNQVVRQDHRPAAQRDSRPVETMDRGRI